MNYISKIELPDGSQYGLRPSLLDQKTYTGVYSPSTATGDQRFFCVKITRQSYLTPWRVLVDFEFTIPNHPEYAYTIIGEDYCGFKSALKSKYTKVNHGDLVACRYTVTAYPTDTTDNVVYMGFAWNANNYNVAGYARDVTVRLIGCENCEAELLDAPMRQTEMTAANYTIVALDDNATGFNETGDSNTTSISNLYHGGLAYTAGSAVYRYQLLVRTGTATMSPLNNVSNNTGTGKAMRTDVAFDPFDGLYYYNASTTVAAAGAIAASYMLYSIAGIDLRYSLNCGTTLTARKPVYLKTMPQGDGTVKLAADPCWTQDLPTQADGYWYILIGMAYSAYQANLYPENPVYYHNGVSVCRLRGPEDIASMAALTVDFGAISSLPITKSVPGVTADMTVDTWELGWPRAFISNLTVTTADGSVTLSGTMAGSSTVILKLSRSQSVTAT